MRGEQSAVFVWFFDPNFRLDRDDASFVPGRTLQRPNDSVCSADAQLQSSCAEPGHRRCKKPAATDATRTLLGLKGVGRCQMIRWCNDRKRLEDDCSSEATEKGAQE